MKKMCDKYIDNIVIAGGAINTLIHGRSLTDDQDIDIFVIGPEPIYIISKLIRTIKKHYVNLFSLNREGTFHFEMTRSISAITITMTNLWSKSYPLLRDISKLKLQIILNEYSCISEILHSFDIDACCIGIHNKNMYFTERFLYSFHYNTLTINNKLFSPSYVYRLYKYYHRGYDIKFGKNIVLHYECGEDKIENDVVHYYLGFRGKPYNEIEVALKTSKAMRMCYLRSMKGIKLLVLMMILNVYTLKFVNSSGTNNKLEDITYSANNDETFGKIVAVRSTRNYFGGSNKNKMFRDTDIVYNNVMRMKYIEFREEDLYIPKKATITSKHKKSFNALDITEEQMYLGTY